MKTNNKYYLIYEIIYLICHKLFFFLGLKYNYNNEHIYKNTILNHNTIYYVFNLFIGLIYKIQIKLYLIIQHISESHESLDLFLLH